MFLNMKSVKQRRSEYGSRTSTLLTPTQDRTSNRKSLHSSVTDRVKYRFQNSGEFDIDINKELLRIITGNIWNLYKVSHLYNLNFTPVKLKQYAARIKQELANNVKDINQDIHFDVKVHKVPILKDIENCYALKIEVYLSRGTKENVLKYKSILLSWGKYTTENDLSHLPFLMCMGAVNITRIVNTAISQLFDTTIRSFRISEDDLMWLSAMVNDTNNSKTVVCYDYKLADSNEKSYFSTSISYDVIKKLWNVIHPPEEDEINFEQVQQFHKEIQCQLIITYGINFELLKLHKITIDNTTISCEGKIKLHSPDAVVKILSFINDIAILLDTCCPTMSDQF